MRRAIAIAVLALIAAACESAVAPAQPVGETRIDCQGVPPQQCQQALVDARASSNVPVVEVTVRCSAPPCAFRQGQIDIQARYADGSTVGWGSAWGEDVPAPMPAEPGPPEPAMPLPVAPSCIGLERELCLEMAVNGMLNVVTGSPPVASITVRCTGVCQPGTGSGDTIVVYADGSSTTSSWAYDTGGGGG